VCAIDLIAQRPAPVAVGPQNLTPIAAPHDPTTIHDIRTADTTDVKRSVKPFLLGGLILGAIVGGALASSYNPCGEPQPGVYCTSTDVPTGAVIGAGFGLLAGWLAWAIAPRAPPDTPAATQ
jgi:hypothetical protein